MFGLFAALALLRWFARGYAYALGRPVRAILSDLAYSGTLLAGIGLIVLGRLDAATSTYAVLAIAVAAGLVPFGRAYLGEQMRSLATDTLAQYRLIWREHTRWSLMGVLFTEATANQHAYLVTLLFGPRAFAPLAASALMIRPISVATNALTDFERVRLARTLADGTIARTRRSMRLFRAMLTLAWIGTAGASVALLVLAPGLIYSHDYAHPAMVTGMALWMATALLRIVRTPEGTLLQAAGAFRPLARISFWSSLVSLAGVGLMLAVATPLWSILGILAGEGLTSLLIMREGRRWLGGRAASPGGERIATVAATPAEVRPA